MVFFLTIPSQKQGYSSKESELLKLNFVDKTNYLAIMTQGKLSKITTLVIETLSELYCTENAIEQYSHQN
jgi:hypothetical protein